MDVTALAAQLQQVMKLNEALRRTNDALRNDHACLLNSTQALIEDRQKLQQRVAELEAANKQLVDMLWARRTERRTISPDQLSLSFLNDPEEPAGAEEQGVLVAEQKADEAFDEQLQRDLEARRQRRRARRRTTQEFPEHLERRERILDLTEEEKAGLKYIGDAVSERMRFEKPNVYIERIIRRNVRRGE